MNNQKGLKILLIDDDPGILRVMTIALEDEGHRVICANDGKIGLELCLGESPDIVITDIRMPGMDGMEVLKKIKEMEPDREVIVATAATDMNYAVEALRLDASDFMIKPIGEQALSIAVKRAQERFATRKGLRDYTALIEERWMETSEELARTFQTQKLLIESSIDGIIAGDKTGRIVIFNKSMEKMLGYSRKEMIGEKKIDRLFCPGEAEKFRSALASGNLGGKGRLFLHESWLEGSDGSRIPVQLSAAEMVHEEERVGVVCFVRDEREIRKLTQEVADQARMLHQDKMISLGKLAASVVHEINNPLAGILNYARLMSKILSRGALSADSAEKFGGYLALMQSELERCAKIVSNLLAFSRKSKLEFGPVDCNELLRNCINLSGHKLVLQNIRVETHLAPGLPMIQGDFSQLQQCIINLIFNAVDAMPEGGSLFFTTSLEAAKNLIRITVKDSGCGISRYDLPYIFDPFFTTKTAGKGVGLGLSTSFGIIDRHKGAIHAKSDPGQGAEFVIELPVNHP
ncbi:MAG: response regulator [Syntrophobacteraceae bacterium]|nr:response regulator [Syntrophobacteraceae bacterium]